MDHPTPLYGEGLGVRQTKIFIAFMGVLAIIAAASFSLPGLMGSLDFPSNPFSSSFEDEYREYLTSNPEGCKDPDPEMLSILGWDRWDWRQGMWELRVEAGGATSTWDRSEAISVYREVC